MYHPGWGYTKEKKERNISFSRNKKCWLGSELDNSNKLFLWWRITRFHGLVLFMGEGGIKKHGSTNLIIYTFRSQSKIRT
jgi:hypothetical protein